MDDFLSVYFYSVPNLRFSSFTDLFRLYTLKDVLQRVSIPVNVEENKLYYQIGIRSHSKGIFHKEAETGKQIGNKRIFWIEPNCLILNIVFAWEQAVAKTSEKEVGMVASHRFPMYKVLNNSLDYIVDFFKTEKGKQLLQMASPGGAGRNKTLNQDFFLNSKIYLPSLNEQLKTSNLIELIEDRIETQIKIIDRLQSQIKYIKGQILNLTTTIEIKSLDQLCDISTGKRDANEMKINGMYKFFTCSREDYCIDTYSFEGEALIISGNGELGLIKYYNGKFDAYQRTYVLQNFNCHPKYLMYVLQSKLPRKIEKEKNVGAMPYIVLKTLTSINVEIPNMHDQIEIVDILNKFEEKLENEQILLELFKKEKSFLLKNLFV